MADQTGPALYLPQPLPLVGRDREQAILRGALAAALAGRGSLVLIGGEAGIGKTALAELLLAEAVGQGALVLVGRCYDLSETPPYGPWRELFDRAPRDDGLPTLPAAVLPPERHGASLTSQDAIARHLVTYLTALGATRPLALLLDDLHWADPASLDLLRVVGRGLGTLPLLLLATYRADEVAPGHALAALPPILVREARAARLDLPPLDTDAVASLVGSRYALGAADCDRLVAYLARRTEGNPLFLGELLRTLESAGVLRRAADGWALGNLEGMPVPPLLRQVIAGRLARLGDEDRRLLAVAAVIGQEPSFDLWAAVGEAAEAALLATAERAVAIRVLDATDTGVRFAHALIREALYDGVLAPRRRAWHRQAGEALLALAHPDPDAVAYHFRRAGDPRAAEWLVRAGERARRAYAWFTAADRYELALPLLEAQGGDPGRRIELLITLAQMHRYGDNRRGVALMEEAARLAEATGDAAQAASARFEAGHLRCIGAADPAGLAAMAAALPALEALSPDERARLPALRILGVAPAERYHRGALAQWSAETGRFREAWDLAAPFRARVPGTTARGLSALFRIHVVMGRPDEARRANAASRAIYAAAGHHNQAGSGIFDELMYIVLPYEAERVAERRRLAAAAAAVLALASDAMAGLPPRATSMELLAREGGWAEARDLARVGRASTWIHLRVQAASVQARVAAWQGDHALAWAAVREVLVAGVATAPGSTLFLPALELLRVAADLARDGGDLSLAREWLAAHDRWLAWSGATLGLAEGALGWAAYHRATGDRATAREQAARALAHASDPRQPLALLAAHRMLGELDTPVGHSAAAATHLDTALALAETCAVPYERALTLLALAELRVVTADREGAGAALAEARALLEPLGARPALARADALAATLARPSAPSQAPIFPAGLSAREVEVLRLIAAGRANQEIAAHLSISLNTVMRHVTHILTKTGTENRAAAAVFALRHGLDAPGDAQQ